MLAERANRWLVASGRRAAVWLVAVAAIGLVTGLVGYVLGGRVDRRPAQPMPNVVGMRLDDARGAL